MTDFSMYFETFGMELLAQPLVYIFFVLKCQWMVEKKWFIAPCAAQADRTLAQGVRGDPEG